MIPINQLQPDPTRNKQDGVAVAKRSEATPTDLWRINPTLPSQPSRLQKYLSPDDLERLRLYNLPIKERYGESFRVFDWSYLVVASPVPSSSASSRGMSDIAIQKNLEAVFSELYGQDGHCSFQSVRSGEDANNIRYAYSLETGRNGWRHAHVLLGNISRLDPEQVAMVFQEHLFGAVDVRVWNPLLEKGYPFKSFDPSSPDYDRACGKDNVKWNRRCKQEMKLHRSHLLRLVGPNASFCVEPRRRATLDDYRTVIQTLKREEWKSRMRSSSVRPPASPTRVRTKARRRTIHDTSMIGKRLKAGRVSPAVEKLYSRRPDRRSCDQPDAT